MSGARPDTGSADLFARWQAHGDVRAREQLVERFLPLARKLAARYRGANEPFEDLLQVASFGLLKAIDGFDPTRGLAFSSYAVPTILGELKRYFRDKGWAVHVPRGAQELALRVTEAERELAVRTGRSPSVPELAAYLGISVEDVLDGLEAAAAHHSDSLDAPRDDMDGESSSIGELLGDEDERFELIEERATIASLASRLSSREREVLTLRFVEEMTQSEIGARIGVSQMQVSRILRRTLDQLRKQANAHEAVGSEDVAGAQHGASPTRRAATVKRSVKHRRARPAGKASR